VPAIASAGTHIMPTHHMPVYASAHIMGSHHMPVYAGAGAGIINILFLIFSFTESSL